MNDSDPKVELSELQDRLKTLNAKSHYLLVALSFLGFHLGASGNGLPLSLKGALTLTSVAAILPIQDFFSSRGELQFVQWFKVVLLFAALFFTLFWIWPIFPAWMVALVAGMIFAVLLSRRLRRARIRT